MVSISPSNLLPIPMIHRSEMTIQCRQKASLIKACLLSITYYPKLLVFRRGCQLIGQPIYYNLELLAYKLNLILYGQ